MNILFWIYKSRTNKAGEAPVKMRITLNGQNVSFNTKVSVDPILWDKDKQRTKGNTPLLREYNNTLMNLTTSGYYGQSLPGFQRKVYHPKGVVVVVINLVIFFLS